MAEVRAMSNLAQAREHITHQAKQNGVQDALLLSQL
jgi:hypothetical protein